MDLHTEEPSEASTPLTEAYMGHIAPCKGQRHENGIKGYVQTLYHGLTDDHSTFRRSQKIPLKDTQSGLVGQTAKKIHATAVRQQEKIPQITCCPTARKKYQLIKKY